MEDKDLSKYIVVEKIEPIPFKNARLSMEMELVFDNDYNVEQITEYLNIKPVSYKNKKDAFINPITKKQNEGYWEIETGKYDDLGIEDVLEEMKNIIFPVKDKIKKILSENDGTIFFTLVVWTNSESKQMPYPYFDKKFLKLVHELNGEIRVILY